MSEATADSKQKTDVKSLNQILMPIFIGVVAEVFVSELKAMTPTMRLFSVLLLGLVYGVMTNSIGLDKLPISRRAALIMTALFIFSGILIFLASFIMNLDAMQTSLLLGSMVLMLVCLWLAKSFPQSLSLVSSALTGAATVGLGAALAIGGAPVAEYIAMGGTNDLVILNNCCTAIAYGNLVIPAQEERSFEMPAISFALERRGGELIAMCKGISIARRLGWDVPLNASLEGCKKIIVDGQILESGKSVTVDMQSGCSHKITIDCQMCSGC
jgi:hypothetical protein